MNGQLMVSTKTHMPPTRDPRRLSMVRGGTFLVWLLVSQVMQSALAHEGHNHGTVDSSVRVWTFHDTGSHIHASYVASSDGTVQVRRADGKVVSLKIAKLIASDQHWIEQKVMEVRQFNEDTRTIMLPRLVATTVAKKPAIADSFEPFAKLNALKYRQDARFFYVESDSMPDHQMMVGITAWQQQVPLPQPYFGGNAWRIPLEPVVSKNPLSAKSHFFRGAIALAANGVPIFNPIKNDGRTDTLLAGELDVFGGHCGRADDYHYHIAPTHLQEIVGRENPVAYALDGYAIYGYTEPDGTAVTGLDPFNGHTSPERGYHYHATKTYPYLNGGFHGEVREVGGQVDPQPQTGGVREALTPLRGAKITGFDSKDSKSFSVKVEVGRETRHVNYVINDDGSVKFDFVDGNGKVKTETYKPRQRGPGGGGNLGQQAGPGGNRPPRDGQSGPGGRPGGNRPPRDDQDVGGDRRPPDGNRDGRGRPDGGRPNGGRESDSLQSANPPLIISPEKSGNFKLTSPTLVDGQPLPNEFNGNGQGATPPLEWNGAPDGTRSFAIVMDHIDRDNKLKTYWNLYGIPAHVTSIPKNVKGIGKIGATWKRDQAYVPPHSAGGGKQTYTLHIYALSIVPEVNEQDGAITRELLLTKINEHILDSSDLNVTYQRPADEAPSAQGSPGGKRGQGGPGEQGGPSRSQGNKGGPNRSEPK
jgi:phosphatidylethanolamine-binding protein (PEBP) family uncharacterized protein